MGRRPASRSGPKPDSESKTSFRTMLPCLLSTIALAPLTASGDGPTNLLTNPSFEAVDADGVQAWRSRAWAGAEGCAWTLETPGRTDARSPANACRAPAGG